MINGDVITVEAFSELWKPIFFSLMVITGIFYTAYKQKKIFNIHFVICNLLCLFSLMDVIVYYLISRGILQVTSFFFDYHIFIFSPEYIIWFLTSINIMTYFQWNVIEKFKDEWSDIKRRRAIYASGKVAMILLLIHIIAYIDTYYRNK